MPLKVPQNNQLMDIIENKTEIQERKLGLILQGMIRICGINWVTDKGRPICVTTT